MTLPQILRDRAARFHRTAETLRRAEDVARLHESAAILEQQADALEDRTSRATPAGALTRLKTG
jgi:hypothetical protein